jgi:hypothetical protein
LFFNSQLRHPNNTDISNSYSLIMKRYDWNDYNNKDSQLINDFQRDFQCCGSFNASKSWENTRPMSVPLGAYPASCCDHGMYENLNIWCDEQEVKHRV